MIDDLVFLKCETISPAYVGEALDRKKMEQSIFVF